MARHRFAAGRLRPRRPRVRRTLGTLARLRIRHTTVPGASGRAGRMRDARFDQPIPFVVGRIVKGNRGMMVLEEETPAPIPGPWDLKAVFSK